MTETLITVYKREGRQSPIVTFEENFNVLNVDQVTGMSNIVMGILFVLFAIHVFLIMKVLTCNLILQHQCHLHHLKVEGI